MVGHGRSAGLFGFTIAQLQSLNFAQMDLTEFYASIVPNLPSAGAMQRAPSVARATATTAKEDANEEYRHLRQIPLRRYRRSSFATRAHAEPIRTPVTDARPVLLAALQSTDGAHGVLIGKVADAITRHFQATSPIYIDVSTVKRYRETGCSRPQGALLAGGLKAARRCGAAQADHRIRYQLLPRRPAAEVAAVRTP